MKTELDLIGYATTRFKTKNNGILQDKFEKKIKQP